MKLELCLRKHAKPNLCDRQFYLWITLFGAMLCAGICDQSDYWVLLFLLQSMKCASMCFTHHLSHDSIVMSAHAFLVFLGLLIFWMGMFKVFRCRVDIWRDRCDRWSCKILVSRVNFSENNANCFVILPKNNVIVLVFVTIDACFCCLLTCCVMFQNHYTDCVIFG